VLHTLAVDNFSFSPPMSLSRERVDDICANLRTSYGTTLPDVVLSTLINHPDHEDSQSLVSRSPAIAHHLLLHPHAKGEINGWAEQHTIATCRLAVDNLLRASKGEEWAPSATSAKEAKLDVAEKWSLRAAATRMRDYGRPLWNILTGILGRPGVEVELDIGVGDEAMPKPDDRGTGQQNTGTAQDVDYEPTHKLVSQQKSRGAELLIVVSSVTFRYRQTRTD
jgi:hypothetical protein